MDKEVTIIVCLSAARQKNDLLLPSARQKNDLLLPSARQWNDSYCCLQQGNGMTLIVAFSKTME